MSINQITPEAIYRQLGSLVAELPDLLEVPVKPATHVWLGRVGALVEAMGDGGKIAAFQVAVRSLHGILQEESAARGYLSDAWKGGVFGSIVSQGGIHRCGAYI
jgi:hypothetical protein